MSKQTLDSYFIGILQLLKNLSSHQIYMEKLRQELCQNYFFDPFTAFKSIDSFKHNMIINVQLKSFLQLKGFQMTNKQALDVIQSLNKGQDSLNYDRFLEMIIPYDIKKRNLSLTRYNKMEVGIGTYQKLNRIKNTSKDKIAQFFIKQVQFVRNYNFQRQQFCRKWGGDVYTIMQHLFRNKSQNLNTSSNHFNTSMKNPLFDYQDKKNTTSTSFKQNEIDFNKFYEFGRKYKFYFNKEQYKSIWRRIKSVQQKIILKPEQIFIVEEDLLNVLLIKDFNTKVKYASQNYVPLKDLYQMKAPSYLLPVSEDLLHNTHKYRQQKQDLYFQQKLRQIKKQLYQPSTYRLKYNYSYPELQHNCVSSKLRQKQTELKEIMNRMNDTAINQRYQQILAKQKGFGTHYN